MPEVVVLWRLFKQLSTLHLHFETLFSIGWHICSIWVMESDLFVQKPFSNSIALFKNALAMFTGSTEREVRLYVMGSHPRNCKHHVPHSVIVVN
jgi:hypothetical protein